MKLSRKQILACTAGGMAMALAAPAYAQTQGEDEIVVTGIKSSLKKSLDLKRGASQVVDAINAEDVGKFPDSNIAESLQRITGVSIERNNGEGQFITVRGLGPEFNTVLVNGRTMATDNAGREFSFDVLAADIISKAEVFKSATPNLQSGGIGAVVNVSTAKPLDTPGTKFTISAAGTYDTLADEISPDITGVASWSNDEGTLGLLGSISYSDRKSQRDFVNVGSGYAGVNNGNAFNADLAGTGQTPAATAIDISSDRRLSSLAYGRDVQSRERITYNGTFQARPSDDIEITLDGLYSQFNVKSQNNVIQAFITPDVLNPTVDGNGTVTGYTRPGTDFYGNNPDFTNRGGVPLDNIVGGNNRDVDSYLFGGNVKWNATNDLAFNFDVSTSKAERDGLVPFIVIGQVQSPNNFVVDATNTEGVPTANFSDFSLADPSLQRAHFVRVSNDTTEDEIFEIKADGRWNADAGPFEALEFGAFYNNREKTFRRNTSQDNRCTFCGYFLPFDQSLLETVELNDFLSGVPGASAAPSSFFTADVDAALAFLTANLDNPARIDGRGLGDAAGLAADVATRGAITGPQGIYTPQNLSSGNFNVEEKITSFFMNTAFSGDFGGELPWSANVGFRVANTDTTSRGVDRALLSIFEVEGDSDLDFVFGPSSDVEVNNSYTSFLPSANLKLDVADDKILRFAVSKTITRPTLTALGVNNSFDGNSTFDAQSGGGNPFLEAFESTNYDAGFEWYYGDVSFFGVNAFHKSFGEFIESSSIIIPRDVTRNSTNGGGVESVDFLDTRDRNGETGSITGVEVALTHAFEGALDGFGTGINYTYVTSTIDRDISAAGATCDYNGLSPHSFNANAFYEKNKIQARVAYNYRDEFLVQCFDAASQPRQRESFGQVDFSGQYSVNDQIAVFVEGVNIFNENTRDFSIFNNRLLDYSETGARFTFGVRGSF